MENQQEKRSVHRKYSLIKDHFPMEALIELTEITMLGEDNNTKCVYVRETLHKYNIPFEGLGSGTNRYGINIQSPMGMVAVKIALDKDGMIDNRREFLYGRYLYNSYDRCVCKTYECLPNGLIAVFEYVTPFTLPDLHRFEDKIRDILHDIANVFMIGDVGVNEDNYKNWGIRMVDGKEEICMLDFAYIYAISYKLFTCNCDNMTLVQYDKDYVNLVCPRCHKKYRFADIRRKVTTQAQEEEIGDIRRLGYVLHQASEMVEDNPEFMPVFKKIKTKKKKITVRDKIKQYDRVTKKDPYGEIWDQLHKSNSKEN